MGRVRVWGEPQCNDNCILNTYHHKDAFLMLLVRYTVLWEKAAGCSKCDHRLFLHPGCPIYSRYVISLCNEWSGHLEKLLHAITCMLIHNTQYISHI